MNMDLAGKVAAVTGASKGIGLAITRALVAEGVQVGAGALENSPELTELAVAGSVLVVLGDLSSSAGCQELVDRTVDRFGGLDLLVNNVGGVRPRLGGFLETTDDDWQWALNLNLLSAVRATRAAIPRLRERTPSTIVTICSVNATLPDPLVMDYSAAKAALRSFSKSLSKEYGPEGIRVNTVSPGPVETSLWLGNDGVAATVSRAKGIDPGVVAAQAVSGTATGRFTRPEEVADLVVMLASSNAGNITGADVLIDGGMVTTM
jgi:NAD(P)-dependent dehydrogenase (short-subunit alcohol dehydrogenase family)